MGLWGVIRERSCRRAVDSCPMSGCDSHTFLELGPGLCKGLQWVGMIHLGRHKSKSHERMLVTNLPYPILDEEPGNLRANHSKACCFIFKAARGQIFMWITKATHLWASVGNSTCFMNTAPIKRKLRSNNISLYRHNTCDQGCEIVCENSLHAVCSTAFYNFLPFTDSLLCA